MIINVLMMSLGLTRDELSTKIESLVADGVYQLTEHRVDGGGSLSTVEMLRQEFNLDEGIISSHWDLAHLLELSVDSTIGKDKNFNKVCEFLCDYLKTYKNDKKGNLFTEASDKYLLTSLKCRIPSPTRFARDSLEFLKTAVRNAAAYYFFLSEKKAGTDPRNNREIDKLNKELKKLQDGKSWLRTCGYIQIFSIVSDMSQHVQSSKCFPTTALVKVKRTMELLEDLSNDWQWSNEDFVGDLGSPKELVRKILDESHLQPVVGDLARKRKAGQIKSRMKYRQSIFGLQQEDEENNSEDEDSASWGWESVDSRPIPLQNFSIRDEEKTCEEMQELAGSLKAAFEHKFTPDSVLEAAVKAFHPEGGVGGPGSNPDLRLPPSQPSGDGDEDQDTADEDQSQESPIITVLKEFHEAVKIDYWEKEEELKYGYNYMMKFREKDEDIEDCYQRFCSVTKGDDRLELYKEFFERIMIKGYSECFCETIGMYSDLKTCQ